MEEPSQAARARTRALRLLARREKSRRGLALSLRRAGFPSAIIREVVDELERAGLVDDRRFCRLFLGEQARLRPRSLRLLRRDLRREGIEGTVIDLACGELGEDLEEALARAAARKALRVAGRDLERARRLLGNRGFTRSVIDEALRSLGAGADSRAGPDGT